MFESSFLHKKCSLLLTKKLNVLMKRDTGKKRKMKYAITFKHLVGQIQIKNTKNDWLTLSQHYFVLFTSYLEKSLL